MVYSGERMLKAFHRSEVSACIMALVLGMASGNRFQEAFVMNCDHTFPDGVTYDLTPLTRYVVVLIF